MPALEPWVMLRLLAGLVATALFARASLTSWRVLRHFDVRRATEGQLALERQAELASTFVRVGTFAQVLALALTALAADKLTPSVHGAMCAWGVFASQEGGFTALGVTGAVALVAGTVAQLYALDARASDLALVWPVSIATLVLAPLAALDLWTTARFFLGLDLSLTASCCSVSLDADVGAQRAWAVGPRVAVTVAALVGVSVAVLVAALAARRPTRARVFFAGCLSLAALPFALGAAVLETAPHAFEAPAHACPFCLLRADVWGLGYPLFGAMFLACTWAVGAGLGGLASGASPGGAFAAFARGRLRRGMIAWAVTLALGALPVVRYALVSGGAPLFR